MKSKVVEISFPLFLLRCKATDVGLKHKHQTARYCIKLNKFTFPSISRAILYLRHHELHFIFEPLSEVISRHMLLQNGRPYVTEFIYIFVKRRQDLRANFYFEPCPKVCHKIVWIV